MNECDDLTNVISTFQLIHVSHVKIFLVQMLALLQVEVLQVSDDFI